MKIELLYFEECPSWQQSLENLRIALREEGISEEISLVRIEDTPTAEKYKFLGSPSVQKTSLL